MQRMSSLIVTACSILLALCPQAAHAMPVGGAVILGFGTSYPAGDGDGFAVHRGVDIACADGENVESPLSGEVGFVGRVPSAAGGTMLAVTIVTERGNLTLMPLSDAAVVRGQRVDAGQRLGSVAVSGDPSTAETHLHVGLKKTGMYLDPSELLQAPSRTGTSIDADASTTADAVVEGELPATAGSIVAEPSGAPNPPTTSRVRGARAPAGGTMPEGVSLARAAPSAQTGAAPLTADTGRPATTPAGTVSAPVVVGGAVAGAPVLPGVGLAAAYAPPASPLSSAAGVLADTLPHASRVSPQGVAALVAALMAGAVLLTRRSLRRRIIASPVSDRLGYLLQHLKAGDTLRGLTSCPGPLPSQSRGRIAQGR